MTLITIVSLVLFLMVGASEFSYASDNHQEVMSGHMSDGRMRFIREAKKKAKDDEEDDDATTAAPKDEDEDEKPKRKHHKKRPTEDDSEQFPPYPYRLVPVPVYHPVFRSYNVPRFSYPRPYGGYW